MTMSYSQEEDLHQAVHRKEYEVAQLLKENQTPSSPLRVAMSYVREGTPPLRLAKALRRVYEDPENTANPNCRPLTPEEEELEREKGEGYARHYAAAVSDKMSMRQGCFVADVKRRSLSRPDPLCSFDDAGAVCAAMVRMGADAVFVNLDYRAYGGDVSELRGAVRAVREVSDTAAVVMKDIVVDEIQLGLAVDAGCDGVLLIASVLGPALENFLNTCAVIGLEAVVECHTRNEVDYALGALAQNILVSNYDRVGRRYYPQQAEQLAGLFPGSGGPIISLAGGGLETTDDVKRVLAAGYDGVVVGKAIMGNTQAPTFIKAVKDRAVLPTTFRGWGLDHLDFDMEGNVVGGEINNSKESSSTESRDDEKINETEDSFQ